MNKYIVRCTCGGVKTKMEAAMKLIAPNEPLPPEYKGSEKMVVLAGEHPHTPFADLLLTLSKKRGRFCYYIETDAKDNVVDARDLMTGRRLV